MAFSNQPPPSKRQVSSPSLSKLSSTDVRELPPPGIRQSWFRGLYEAACLADAHHQLSFCPGSVPASRSGGPCAREPFTVVAVFSQHCGDQQQRGQADHSDKHQHGCDQH